MPFNNFFLGLGKGFAKYLFDFCEFPNGIFLISVLVWTDYRILLDDRSSRGTSELIIRENILRELDPFFSFK